MLLELKNASIALKKEGKKIPVVTGVSLSVDRGKTVALVGESGCGKSVLALSLIRLLSSPFLPPSGEAFFQGEDLYQLKERTLKKIRGREIAFIFQDPSACLDPLKTIKSQLSESLDEDLSPEELDEKLVNALKEVGISQAEKRLNDYPHRFSGGMKQRILIAGVLLFQPSLILADEPTTALDVTLARQVMDLIKKAQKKNNSGLLLITHDIHLVRDMADEVYVMYAGQIVESGPCDEVLSRPLHPYTQGLLNSLPIKGQPLTPIKGTVPEIGNFPEGCRFRPRCPYAFDKCHLEVPFFERDPRRRSRCWLLEEHDTLP